MTLKDQITEDMKNAMRAKEVERLGTIRLLLAAIKQREVDERIVVDDDTVVTEGWFHQIFPGTTLLERGADIDDPSAAYQVTMRLLLLWPFTETGELIGEDSYAGSTMFAPGSVRKLDEAEIPEEFRAALRR